MSKKGRDVFLSAHPDAAGKIEVIPHGIPDRPFLGTHAAKAKFGLEGKTVILTFGLLSPNKGIETVIDAMPGILAACPNAVYLVLGATHPNLMRAHGEAYRESLMQRARELGVDGQVVFLNRFVEQAMLLDYISACDVYVTPYLNEGPDDIGHACLQLRAREGRRVDALLARQGAACATAAASWFRSEIQRPSGRRSPVS